MKELASDRLPRYVVVIALVSAFLLAIPDYAPSMMVPRFFGTPLAFGLLVMAAVSVAGSRRQLLQLAAISISAIVLLSIGWATLGRPVWEAYWASGLPEGAALPKPSAMIWYGLEAGLYSSGEVIGALFIGFVVHRSVKSRGIATDARPVGSAPPDGVESAGAGASSLPCVEQAHQPDAQ